MCNTSTDAPVMRGCGRIVQDLNGCLAPVDIKKNAVSRTALDVAVLLIGGAATPELAQHLVGRATPDAAGKARPTAIRLIALNYVMVNKRCGAVLPE